MARFDDSPMLVLDRKGDYVGVLCALHNDEYLGSGFDTIPLAQADEQDVDFATQYGRCAICGAELEV